MPVTNYLWDVGSDNLLLETDASGATTAVYTNEPDVFGELVSQRRGGVTSYYHFDAQRSTRELTDAHQNVTDAATYTAFGEAVASSGVTSNPFGYQGALGYYVNPETNDLYVRARFYAAQLGRFCSRDPLDYRARFYAAQLGVFVLRDSVRCRRDTNLYSVSRNSPGNLTDPSGLQPYIPPNLGAWLPPYDPTETWPCREWQVRPFLKYWLASGCSSCNYCTNATEVCNEVECMTEASLIAEAITNTLQRNTNWPWCRLPFGTRLH